MLPYYVSPEQMIQDKAEYALKGIARGRSIIAMEYTDGILLVADNPSIALKKVSEVYDNIAFAGAGRYSEFENIRKAGIRHADLKGYLYSRHDVTAKSLANAYSQSLGNTFSQDTKPLEVEILVVGIGEGDHSNEIFRLTFDGSIYDEKGFTVIGGESDHVKNILKEIYREPGDIAQSLQLAMQTLGTVNSHAITPDGLEAAVLDRNRSGRKFKRLTPAEIHHLVQ